MFVKIYRYMIRKKDLVKWKRIVGEANKIYKNYGAKDLHVLVRRNGNIITIMEVGYYKSRKEFLTVSKKADKDERISELFKEFLQIVNKNKIVSEEFETVYNP